MRPWPWEDLGAIVALAFFTLLSVTIDQLEASSNSLFRLVYAQRTGIYIVLACVVVVLPTMRALRRNPKKERIRMFLECIHERYFPAGPGQLHPDFRVTLFVPCIRMRFSRTPFLHRRLLKVYARSAKLHPTSRVKWDIDRSQKGDYDGIAGAAAATGTFIEVDNLPDYQSAGAEDKMAYLRRTYVTEEKASRLNRHARSYRALAVKDSKGNHIAALMMEAQDPAGLSVIDGETLYWEARHLQTLFM